MACINFRFSEHILKCYGLGGKALMSGFFYRKWGHIIWGGDITSSPTSGRGLSFPNQP